MSEAVRARLERLTPAATHLSRELLAVDVEKGEVRLAFASRPEFLNRLDETIIFDRLARADMDGIVTIQLGLLDRRLAARNIALALDDDARQWLADEGYDPVFGARPLKRVIQRALQDRLAEMILAGDIADGATVPVSVGPDGLIVGGRVSASNRQLPQGAVVH